MMKRRSHSFKPTPRIYFGTSRRRGRFAFRELNAPSGQRVVWVDGTFNRHAMPGVLQLSRLGPDNHEVFEISSESELMEALDWAADRPYVFVGIIVDSEDDLVWQISQRVTLTPLTCTRVASDNHRRTLPRAAVYEDDTQPIRHLA